jgi:hypothetical protein
LHSAELWGELVSQRSALALKLPRQAPSTHINILVALHAPQERFVENFLLLGCEG